MEHGSRGTSGSFSTCSSSGASGEGCHCATWWCRSRRSGRPHYHYLVFLPKALSLPLPDKRGWWRYGSSKQETARCAVAYLAKYASKCIGTAFELPKGARISGGWRTDCGAAGRKKLVDEATVGARSAVDSGSAREVKGGYMARATGEFLKSPWRMVERGEKWDWFEFTDEPPDGNPCRVVGQASRTFLWSPAQS